MDNTTRQVNNMLFDVFGLCPEYEIRWTEHEWVEFYSMSMRAYTTNSYSKSPAMFPTDRTRLRLNEHKVMTDGGIEVSANFAVDHPSKTIFLGIIRIGGHEAFGKVQKYG